MSMKRISSVFILLLPIFSAIGQPAPVIRITGTRLVHPIFRKWIAEYTKTHPEISILVDGRIPADSADLLIASHILRTADLKPGQGSVVLNRYLQLPVVNSARRDAAAMQSKGFTEADFRRIYFGEESRPELHPENYPFVVYKREKPACASIAFANHFGGEQKDIAGKGIGGDDRDLLEAVIKDTNGISYNNLGFLYDLGTRKPMDGIAIIPLDLNANGRVDPSENIYGSLDQVIAFAEKSHNHQLPIENVHVIFSRANPNRELARFLQWILTEGQQYDHAFGFLTPPRQTLREQQQIVAGISINQSTPIQSIK